MSKLVLAVKALVERLPLGVLSDFHRSEWESLLSQVGEVKTKEHSKLWYEMIWCQKEMIERHRQRVLVEVRALLEFPEYTLTPCPPIPAPATWMEARMLAIKKACPECQWWHSEVCSASQLPSHTKAKGPVPEKIASDMFHCRRDAEETRTNPIQQDPRLG